MPENMLISLRFRRIWLGIGWSLVMIVIILSLIPAPAITQTFRYVDKISHMFSYFVLMGWFAQIYHSSRQRLYYLIGFVLLGMGLEILQDFGGIRHADWLDACANSIGVILAWYLTKNQGGNLLNYMMGKNILKIR